jgi:hypothetical protein
MKSLEIIFKEKKLFYPHSVYSHFLKYQTFYHPQSSTSFGANPLQILSHYPKQECERMREKGSLTQDPSQGVSFAWPMKMKGNKEYHQHCFSSSVKRKRC